MDLNFSVSRIILLTYAVIASSYCSDLFSNGLKHALETNKYAQHIILIILIIALMIVFGNPFGVTITSNQQIDIVIMSLLVYVWFIMTTKLDLAWNIGVLILLTIYFLYESSQVNDYKNLVSDNLVEQEKKKEIIDYYTQIQKYVLVSLFGLTIIGTLFYASEKQVQYGGNFNVTKFIFN